MLRNHQCCYSTCLKLTHFDSTLKVDAADDDHPLLTKMLEIETYLSRKIARMLERFAILPR